MILIGIITIVIVILLIALFITLRKKGTLGSLGEKIMYQDSSATPGEMLYAKSVSLVGKPDFIIRNKDGIIPVEVKTGKAPAYPYENHIMQLMAYCLLIEETYQSRPVGGIIRYQMNGTEFKIAYTKEAEKSVKNLIVEITEMKQSGIEPHCKHPEHNA